MLVFFRILGSGFVLAIQEMWNNKLRTFLSMLGITIGIFCVISVMMMVNSVQVSIKDSLKRLGDDVVYIDRFPWGGGDDQWWEYLRRPVPSYRDYLAIQRNTPSADHTAIRIAIMGKDLKYKKSIVENIRLAAASQDMGIVFGMEFEAGRYFSSAESSLGENVIVIGHKIATELFPKGANPIGKQVKLMGLNLRVIGVLKKEGSSLIGDGFDQVAFVPYNYMRRYIDVNSQSVIPLIAVKAQPNVSLEQLKDDITGALRAHRRLRPSEEDNFSLNQTSILTAVLDGIFGIVNLAGFVIGLFAILVGGFGIANIMFVSVKERTNIIGIKKSLGAKKHFILFEFLIESICLCVTGGLVGLLLVLLTAYIGNYFIDSFELVLSMGNVYMGITISVLIGVIAGFIPAWNASRLDPVEAIRQK